MIEILATAPATRLTLALRQKCCYWKFLWTVFSRMRLNAERYGVYFRIQSECGEMRTRKSPNADTFQAVQNSVHECCSDVFVVSFVLVPAYVVVSLLFTIIFHARPYVPKDSLNFKFDFPINLHLLLCSSFFQ